MGYKPLANISFSELQSLLSNLTLITMDNEQVFSINSEGFDFDSGEITLKDPPPEYALINAHMADSDIHGSHAALLLPWQTRGIRAKNANAAATLTTTNFNAPLYHRTFEMGIYLPKALSSEACIFYRMKNELGANLFEFGKDEDYNLYVKIGETVITSTYVEHGPDNYLPFDMDATEYHHDVGCMIDDLNINFCYYGFKEAAQSLGTWEYPASSSVTIELLLNCPGVELSYCRMLKGRRYPDGTDLYTPLGKGLQTAIHHYYDFNEASGATLYDYGAEEQHLTLTADGERCIISL